jgi:hypothetical protein
MIGETMAEPDWKWVEGAVDTDDDHIKIRYGDDPESVALFAPGPGKTFTVEFLPKLESLGQKDQEILDDISEKLDFFLVELGEEDPWAYAIYHCSTASNMYSNVRWGYYPKGYKGR